MDLNEKHSSRIIVCIPAHNESNAIGEIVRKARNYATEIIVYDDGSTDNTYDIAMAAGADNIIRSPVNNGYGVAIRSLFQAAREKNADIMVTIDSDGQHYPEQIPDLIKPIIEEGIDMVIGSRFLSPNDTRRVPRYRSLGIRTITKLAQSASYNNITDSQNGFRAYSRNALLKLTLFENGMPVSSEILLNAKQKNLTVKEVPITVRYDIGEKSSQNPLFHGAGLVSALIQFISLHHPLASYGIPGIVLLIVAAIFANIALDLISKNGYVSTNLVMASVGSGVIGAVLLVTSTILYTLTALLKGNNGNGGIMFTLIQFISLRHPLASYGIPGIVLLIVAAIFANIALDLISKNGHVSTNLVMISVGSGVIGAVLLVTSTILYTLTALLKGRIKDI
jgi:glycosyltransferase involved in cell wall biosynthesis